MDAPRVNKLMLWCLLILDLIAFGFICWLYPILWAPPAEEEGEASKCYYPLGNMYVDHICANNNIIEVYIDDTITKTMAKLYGERE